MKNLDHVFLIKKILAALQGIGEIGKKSGCCGLVRRVEAKIKGKTVFIKRFNPLNSNLGTFNSSSILPHISLTLGYDNLVAHENNSFLPLRARKTSSTLGTGLYDKLG